MAGKVINKLLILGMAAVMGIMLVTAFNDEKEVNKSECVLETAKKSYLQDKDKIKGAVGYLSIPDTTIDYPIMQSEMEQPDFFLSHDINKKHSRYGTPYLSAYCDVKISDNLIIYAHNINGHRMFGALEYYKDKDYYRKHKYIYFETDTKTKYEIIGVMSVDIKVFPYYRFIVAKDEKDYRKFVRKVKKNSLYECSGKAAYGKQLITLSTCDNNRGDNYRLVVAAVRL